MCGDDYSPCCTETQFTYQKYQNMWAPCLCRHKFTIAKRNSVGSCIKLNRLCPPSAISQQNGVWAVSTSTCICCLVQALFFMVCVLPAVPPICRQKLKPLLVRLGVCSEECWYIFEICVRKYHQIPCERRRRECNFTIFEGINFVFSYQKLPARPGRQIRKVIYPGQNLPAPGRRAGGCFQRCFQRTKSRKND